MDSTTASSSADDDFCLVEENLYIGSYRSVCLLQDQKGIFQSSSDVVKPVEFCRTAKISPDAVDRGKVAVLTVDSRKLPRELTDLLSAYKFVNVEDSLQFEFIQHFDECCAFIDEHRGQNRPVLVHCNAGLSRSATLIAAYLMREHGWPVTEAVNAIKKARPGIEPNSNFFQQLGLYSTMGFKLDRHNTAYRQWRLRLLTQTGFPVVDIDSLLANAPEKNQSPSDLYCCRLCRCPLFGPSNQMSHSSALANPSDTDAASLTPSSQPQSCLQKELFIEPVTWMRDEISQMEGKLNCPQCSKKVGTFAWFGDKCPCGVFVTPSFHMDKSKVEMRLALAPSGS